MRVMNSSTANRRIGAAVGLLLATLVGCAAPAVETSLPPPTDIKPVTDVIQGVSFVDPYRWLEDQSHPDVRAWVDRQNLYAESVVARFADRDRLRSRLRALMDRADIGRPQRGGAFEYFTLRRPGEEQAAIYRRAAGNGRSAPIDPARIYDVVVDARPLSADLTTSIDLVAVSADGTRLVYGVRDGGQDERELRVRDVAAGVDLERFPPALYDSVTFHKEGVGLYYVRRSRQSGPRVRLHRWGNAFDDDDVIFGDGFGPTAFLSFAQSDDARWFLFTVRHGWARAEVWLQDRSGTHAPVRVTGELDAHFAPRFVKDEVWMLTDWSAPMSRIVAFQPSAPQQAAWRTVLPETADVLEDYAVIGDRLYATYIRDASNRIAVFDLDGRPRGELELPDMVSASIRGDGPTSAVLTVESFTQPEITYRLDVASGERTIEQAPTVTFDAAAYAVERVSATSADGTAVPVFVVGRRDRPRDGSSAALLFGYGGFLAPQKPRFNPAAAAWLEAGGVYASAVLRGGNERGEAWHRGGMLTNKGRVFEDFIAAAETLVANGTTRADRLAITGVSNGGLLVGAALTKRPDLYRAVLCGFPDVDILRFNQFTTANNMPALLEYGDAAIEEQFQAIRLYSPYQHVEEKTAYPAVMITSGDLDTRVPPLAARKFAARLQAATTSGRPVILRYHPKAGHATGNGLPFSGRVEMATAQLAFVMTELQLSLPTAERTTP